MAFSLAVFASATLFALEPLAGDPQGVPLLSADLHLFKAYGAGAETSSMEVVPVAGQPFGEALRLTTVKEPARTWDVGSTAALTAPLHKGDTVWISLWARRVATLRESGEAQVEAALLQTVDGHETRPLQRVLSVGPEWTRIDLPFGVASDAPLGAARLAFRYGYGAQCIEVGGIRLIDCGQNVAQDSLPRTVVRYDGWAADAPWRQAAAERIEQIRKGDLTVVVTNADGSPAPDAQVQVRMKRHAFAWGAAIDEKYLVGEQNADSAHYQQTLEKYFNKIVFENSLKWGHWIEPGSRERVNAALDWLKARNIATRGHVLVWPSWKHSPGFLRDYKGDPAALKKAISDHIADETGALKGRFAEWDVINETYTNHDILDLFDRSIMLDWFREARAGAPEAKLFYNDFTMFQKGEGQDAFYNTVKFLKDGGAPIDAFGEQGHFAGSPPGIPEVLATLDKFGGLGLPIQISEFDVDTDDVGLQADFMRDFTTAVFSHPSVMGMMQWGFWAKAHWLPRAALWDKDWNLRPNGKAWVDLVSKTWWTNADGATDRQGQFKTRGFYGEYDVVVTRNDKTSRVSFSLSPQTLSCPIVLP